VAKRAEHAERDVIWSIAARPSSYQHHGEGSVLHRVERKIEYVKAQLRAKVEPPSRSSRCASIIARFATVAWKRIRRSYSASFGWPI
jgi:hypothetical protein